MRFFVSYGTCISYGSPAPQYRPIAKAQGSLCNCAVSTFCLQTHARLGFYTRFFYPSYKMFKTFYVGQQSYQINHISCSKDKNSIQQIPAVCSFFGWYCLPNLAKLFYRGIVLNHRRCPRAMSSRYNVWNISLLSFVIHTNKFYRVLVYQKTQLYKWSCRPVAGNE